MNKLLKLGYLLLLLVACAGQPATPADFLPKAGVVPEWTPVEEPRVYQHDNLFDMVDGQADAFFVYGFEQVARQRYQNPAGTTLEVVLWQLATPADAYGLFTSGLAGEPATVCPTKDSEQCYEADIDSGRRLAFWQNRYYAQVYSRQQLANADLQAFAAAVSSVLPAGGNRPNLVNRLPQTGLVERGFIFFHEEISIQDQLWLGGKNILGLSHQTNGLLAQYKLNDITIRLLLIEYPEPQAASTGLAALRKASQVEDMVDAEAQDNLLGAIFGQVEQSPADDLLIKTLGKK